MDQPRMGKPIRIKDMMSGDVNANAQTVVKGWVRSKRVSKKRAFIILADGSYHLGIQCVMESDHPDFSSLHQVLTGCAIEVSGQLVDSPGSGQSKEIMIGTLVVLGGVGEDYPLQKKSHSFEFLREVAHFRPRSQTLSAVMKVRHVLSMATHEYFHHLGLLWVHTPIITASDAEGAGEMFTVTSLDWNQCLQQQNRVDYSQDFFGQRAYLSVTGQLQAEYLAMGLGGVYTFGPTFRAENSHTRRHLAEFWMIEPEVAFMDLDDCIALACGHIRHMIHKVLTECVDELKFFESKNDSFRVSHLKQIVGDEEHFVRMSYDEALNECARSDLEPLNWGDPLSTEHEKYLCEKVFEAPVFVTDYPKGCKAFYMRQNDEGQTVSCFDLLVPRCGELIGGSQREERYDQLKAAMTQNQISSDLDWYLELRRHGSVIHSGYGLGLERMVLLCTGVDNVRDTIPSPRTPGQIKF